MLRYVLLLYYRILPCYSHANLAIMFKLCLFHNLVELEEGQTSLKLVSVTPRSSSSLLSPIPLVSISPRSSSSLLSPMVRMSLSSC